MRAAALMTAVVAAVFLMIETARAAPVAAALSAAPANLGRIDAAAASPAAVTSSRASPGQTYTLTTREEGTDALRAPLAPPGRSRPVKAPLLP